METENRREGKQELENSHTTAVAVFVEGTGFLVILQYLTLLHQTPLKNKYWQLPLFSYKNNTDIFLIWIHINNI